MSVLTKRTAATEKTVSAYIDATSAWYSNDCLRGMTVAHIRNMGHRVSLLKVAKYTDEAGAQRALKKLGYERVEDLLTARFGPPIPPAAAWVGDILALPSEGLFPAMAIRLTNGRALHSFKGSFGISQPHQFIAAWRVPYVGK